MNHPSSSTTAFVEGLGAATGNIAAAALRRPTDPPQTLAEIGSTFVSRLTGVAEQELGVQLLAPSAMAQIAAGLLGRSEEACRATIAGTAGMEALELRNKGTIFTLVQGVSLVVGEPSTFPLPIGELVCRAYALGPFPALWAVEGLGHDYTKSFLERGIVPDGLLARPRRLGLPEASLTMMHAGLGLAFAEKEFEELAGVHDLAAVRRRVARFIELCYANSHPGYVGAALESLGLETRLFFPSYLHEVDRALGEIAPGAERDYFWHGAGRSLYFQPASFLPFSLWELYRTVRREAPDERARLNATAGLTWAFTLVNELQPRIMADLLITPHGEELAGDDGFKNGVASAVTMRQDTTPNAPFIRAFCDAQPTTERAAVLWNDLVRRPCELAVNVIQPTLSRRGLLGEVFRFHPLPRLAHGTVGAAPGRRRTT